MASNLFNNGKKTLLRAWIDDTYKVLLVTSNYAPNPDHNFVSDVAPGNELSGTGYVAGFAGSGRKTLAGKALTQDDANDQVQATATATTFTSLGGDAGQAAYAIIYKPVTSDADSPVIACVDIPNTTGIGTDIVVNWPVAALNGGIFYM